MLISLLLQNPLFFVLMALGFAVCITVHEFSHVFSAYLQGDTTGKDAGRLTLNPLAHLDPIGSLALLFLPFGWGRPAPYNPYHLRNPRFGPLLVALAGPFSNLVLVFVFGVALHALYPILGQDNFLTIFLQILVTLNALLMIFNLLPIPPLDGSMIIQALFARQFPQLVENLFRYGPNVLFGLILLSWVMHIPLFSFVFEPILQLVRQLVGVPLPF